jgi:hypothetical protein
MLNKEPSVRLFMNLYGHSKKRILNERNGSANILPALSQSIPTDRWEESTKGDLDVIFPWEGEVTSLFITYKTS